MLINKLVARTTRPSRQFRAALYFRSSRAGAHSSTTGETDENGNHAAKPLATDGFEFVEYTAPTEDGIAKLKALFLSLGFSEVARHRSKNVSLFRQGDINFILNGESSQPAKAFGHEHGPSACAMAWRVKDAAKAYEYALAHGARV